RQWRVAWAHVRRAPRWALGAGALLTVVSIVARALILPALAWGMPGRPPFAQMFYGALALLHAPLVVPLPSGGGGLEVAFLNGFAGDFGPHQVTVLLLWRFYTAILLTGLGVYALVRSIGYRAAVEVFKIGRGHSSEEPRTTWWRPCRTGVAARRSRRSSRGGGRRSNTPTWSTARDTRSRTSCTRGYGRPGTRARSSRSRW